MRWFYPVILITSVVFTAVAYLLIQTAVIPHDNWPYGAVALFLFITVVNSLLIRVSMTGKAKTFLYAFGGASALRFFLSVLFIVSYLIFSDKRDVHFVVFFMVMYFFFTMFEIIHLVAKLRAEKNSRIEATND